MGFVADADADASMAAIEHKAYARVGFLGNPSDVYYGRTISFTISNFWASVRLQPSDNLVFLPHPTHDLVQFRSLDHLVCLFLFTSSLYLYIYLFLYPFLFLFLGLIRDI